MKASTALVLSGGGMFGAWQAGAWKAIAEREKPDLIVGASVGALNGFAIAGSVDPAELCKFWLQPELAMLSSLPQTIQTLMVRYPLKIRYAAVLTDLLRLKPTIIQNSDVTWRHLAASCAIPLVLPQHRIDGRWYSDGGLLNPLPVWAAVELGATRIIALHALPEIPSAWLKPFVTGFRQVAGHHPALPSGVDLQLIKPARTLGSLRDALHWRRENIERWLEEGFAAAAPPKWPAER